MRVLHCVLASLLLAPTAVAQDLYDDTVLRTVALDFHDTNWWTLLEQNYDTGVNILADMTVDAVVYPSVGVRIKGNSSYFALPPGSQKVSFNVEVDFVDPVQRLYGSRTLNFNNAFTDPTFCREVAFCNAISKYTPNGRGNHIKLLCNGENWGVYANIEQYNKDVLRQFFPDEDGVRIKCPNKPNGPGLQYEGDQASDYQGGKYELHDDGGLADPWQVLIDTCDVLNHEPLNNWPAIDDAFAIDRAMWTIASENLFTDDDSYLNKGADFYAYWDPQHSRMHLHQHDGNEVFRDWNMPPLFHINDSSKPVLNRLWAVSELRERYLAHLRTMLKEFDWTLMEAKLFAYRDLLDAEVQADDKKLYTYQQFLDNFTTTVNLGGGGPGGGSLIGLQEFVEMRRDYLINHPVLNHPTPIVNSVEASSESPAIGEQVTVTAQVDPAVSVSGVTLYWRSSAGRYQSSAMFDDGLHGDGGSADDVWGADLPNAGLAGETVEYYVGTRASVGAGAAAFLPEQTEMDPLILQYPWNTSGLKITEYMYTGVNGEFIELTNTTSTELDLSGWSLDDQSSQPGTFDLSAAGLLAAGESVIVTSESPIIFSAVWGLSGTVVLGPNTVAPFGRNDQINVFDAGGQLVERLTYGDENFPGSPRANGSSASPCSAALGADDPYSWILALVGDAFGSTTSSGGDVGSPGTHTQVACSGIGTDYCDSNDNSSGVTASLTADGSALVTDNDVTFLVDDMPTNQFGYLLMSEVEGFVPFFGGSQGNLCLGGSIVRFSHDILSSGGLGSISFKPDLTNLPQGTVIAPGSRWHWQFWFRDVNPTQTSNTSNGLAIDFL